MACSSFRYGDLASSTASLERPPYSASTASRSSRSSSCFCRIDRAYPKKSSARRKNPLRVRFVHDRRKYWASLRTAASEASVLTLSLPTVMDSMAHANVSRIVDLPEPFSPTKKVTGDLKSIPLSDRTISNVNGKRRVSCPPNSRTVKDFRWIRSALRYFFFHFFIGRTKSYG